MAGNVAAGAGIVVMQPCAADVLRLFQNNEAIDTFTLKPRSREKAGHPGADDHGGQPRNGSAGANGGARRGVDVGHYQQGYAMLTGFAKGRPPLGS